MVETKMQLVDWLDDLTVRFLLNLPPTELSSVPRLCFQVEEAQWFYEDFIRPAAAAAGSPLPSLPLKQFCLLLFQHCPLLSGFTDAQHIAAYEEFLAYKVRVPVRGAILMDEAMEKVILVKGWKKGASWSFPRGKINKDEKDLDCAIREVDEETGYDLRAAGLVPVDESKVRSVDVTMKEQQLRMFIFRGVPQDTVFAPKTRKEISKIAWYNVRDLPGFKKVKNHADAEVSANKFYMVAPFLGQLKKWIAQQRKMDAAAFQSAAEHTEATEDETTDALVENPTSQQPLFDRSAELKKLLSIGSSEQQPNPVPEIPQDFAFHNAKSADLLTLLKDSAGSTTRQFPATAGHQFAPQLPPSGGRLSMETTAEGERHRLQSREANAFSANNVVFIPGQEQPFPPIPAPNLSGATASRIDTHPTHKQQFPNRRGHDVPLPPHTSQMHQEKFLGSPPGTVNPQILHPMPVSQVNPALAPATLMPQGLSGRAIGSGPTAPQPNQLPPPRLTHHSMKLLDAFKGGTGAAGKFEHGHNSRHPSYGNAHQSALLDLFRKQSESAKPLRANPTSEQAAEEVEIAARPKASQERRPTLNEITRTLPVVSSNRRSSSSNPLAINATTVQHEDQQSQNTRAANRPREKEQPHNQPAFKILQRQPSASSQAPLRDHGTSVPMARPRSTQSFGLPVAPNQSADDSSNPAIVSGAKVSAAGLHRPGSSRGSMSPTTNKSGSSRKREVPLQKQTFQPQVLRRPKHDRVSLEAETEISMEVSREDKTGKTDKLLALFAKPTSPKSLEMEFQSQPTDLRNPVGIATGGSNKQAHLLSLLKKPPPSDGAPHSQASVNVLSPSPSPTAVNPFQQPTQLSTLPLPDPPSAPRLSPTTKTQALQPSQPHEDSTQQTQLLNLFTHRPQTVSQPKLASPNTPISPFALPTPTEKAARGMSNIWSAPTGQQTENKGRNELFIGRGSGRSTPTLGFANDQNGTGHVGNGSTGRASVSTPIEHKDFLLGFLNGVVQREGANRKH